MNDRDYNTIYDTAQEVGMFEVPDQPAENERAHNDDILEDSRSENNLYATKLESHYYNSYATGGEENSWVSSQPKAESYLLPDEVCPEARDLPPGGPQKEKDISMKKLHLPTQDQEPSPAEPQENGSMMKEDLPSPSSFTVQESSESPPTRCSAADGLEENESFSIYPEIILFVKVRAASDRHTCMCRQYN
uniref:Uncharacterized protein n=1 Tax=Rousettus aegyptiacus TaxID=9407 RepID=A0A7J8KBB4_ROUAE|nr:hypothetical protein HJG63_007950 [Rousettus aegyptiacus]